MNTNVNLARERCKTALKKVFVLVPFLIASALALLAQSDSGTIQGFVSDSSNAGVPQAALTITDQGTGFIRKASTDATGFFAVTGVPPGTYTVRAEAPGFKATEVTNNKLDASVPLNVPITLEIGRVSDLVEVSAVANAVQSDTAAIGRVITNDQIKNLQLNGRNPVVLAQLLPGVTRSSAISSFTFGLESQLNINGSRDRDNLITIDGAPAIRTRAATFPIGVSDLDSTQEVQVLTANYRAEYGRSDGGQIRIITRSGTREFHGQAYEYFRNSALDANSWTRNASSDPVTAGSAAPFRFNQFGWNLSGSVLLPKASFNRDRNKLFWLFGEEITRYRQTMTNTFLVPTNAMRSGDFSELLGPNLFYGGAKIIRNPATGIPYANNIIPASQLSPNGLGMLKAFPSPTPGLNLGGRNAILSLPAPQNQQKDTAAVDYLASEKHVLHFRYLHHSLSQYTPFRGNYDRGRRTLDFRNQVGSVNYTWTISPSLVNELVSSASLDRTSNILDRSVNTYNRNNYRINYPYLFPNGKARPEVIPSISIAGLLPLSSNQEGKTAGPIYTVSDNLTKVVSHHILKFGFYFERSGENENGGAIENGSFTFTDTRTGAPTSGIALANAALGLYDSYSELGPYNYVPFRGNMYEYYVQDAWKASSRLQVEIGVRHSLIQPYYSLWRNLSYFDSRFYNAAAAPLVDRKTGTLSGGDPFNGIVIPGSGFPSSEIGRLSFDPASVTRLFRGVDKSYSEFHKTDLQPRLGLAYLLTKKTVVRAGAGEYELRPPITDTFNPGQNPPFQPNAFLANGNVDNPAGGTSRTFPSNIGTIDRVYDNPRSWVWNGTVEQSLPGDTLLSVGYVGRRGLHLAEFSNINQMFPGTVQANTGVNQNALRPHQGYGQIFYLYNSGSSKYNSLQVALNRRYKNGLLFGVAYTLSKSTDDTSINGELLPNAYDQRSYWGPSAFDRRHVLVANFAYDLPLFRNGNSLTHKLLGGWQINGISQFQTGTPLTISTTDDFAGVGSGSGPQIWNISGNPVLDSSDRHFASSSSSNAYWFRTTSAGNPVFTSPASGTFTSQLNRDRLYGPGYQSWNAALLKSFHFTERQALQFRFELFNWPNHPNWDNPNTNPRSLGPNGTFGKVTTKSSERNMQLSLRYSF